MDMNDILEEYRKIKLKEELDKALYDSYKYEIIKVEIEYKGRLSHSYFTIPVDTDRFRKFIANELKDMQKEMINIDRNKSN